MKTIPVSLPTMHKYPRCNLNRWYMMNREVYKINRRCSGAARQESVEETGLSLSAMPTMAFTHQLSALSESVSEHPNTSNIASQSRRKSDGEPMANGGVCGDWSISAPWMGGVVGEISCGDCGNTGDDVFIISPRRTSKHELLRGSRGPAGFRRRA